MERRWRWKRAASFDARDISADACQALMPLTSFIEHTAIADVFSFRRCALDVDI